MVMVPGLVSLRWPGLLPGRGGMCWIWSRRGCLRGRGEVVLSRWAGLRPMREHRSLFMLRLAMVVEGRVLTSETMVGPVMAAEHRMVGLRVIMGVDHHMVPAARPRTPAVVEPRMVAVGPRVLTSETMVGPGMAAGHRMAGRRVSMVAGLVMCRSRRAGRGRGVPRMRTACRVIILPGRAIVGVSREVMFLGLLGRNRMLTSRNGLTGVLVTGRVQRAVGTISIGLVLMPVILPNPEPTPHPTTIRVGTSIPMWMKTLPGIGVLMWMSIRVGIGVLMWMKILAGVSIPVTGLMVVTMVWMIIVIRMRVLVLVVMGRIMGDRVRETIR